MKLQEWSRPMNDEMQVIRFVPPSEFKREATDWMKDVTDQLKFVEERGVGAVTTDHISRSMGAFHRQAASRGLNEVADLALSVARALESTPGRHETARRVVALSLAAVSQIQCLLNPSVEGAGRNARRIVHGLLHDW
ncbi:MAG: hypothetical protein HQL97_09115 [Magnetococcales bacterium]|nr:hypothetical protein [Magnetococcales bacterium]